MLPFDLHVLSLPLAFILSQDQTLHCKKCKILFPDLLSLFSNLTQKINGIFVFMCCYNISKNVSFFKLFQSNFNPFS